MVRTVGIRDARIDVATSDTMYVVEEGPANVTYQVAPASNQSSTNTTTFQVTPPSPNVGLNRFLQMQVSGTITIQGANLDNPAYTQYAMRAWPLASSMSSIQVQLNNSNISYANQNQWMNAYSRVSNPAAQQSTWQSGTAAAPDVLNQYADVVLTASSPFLSGADVAQGDGISQPRTEQITSVTVSGSGANVTVVLGFTITEPIVCGPFVVDTDKTSALFGLNQINVTVNWGSLWKMLSIAVLNTNATINTITTAFTQQQLLLNYVTPSEDSLVARPIKAHYSCPEIRLYSNALSTVLAPGASTQCSTASITLPRCPRLAVLFATPPQSQILSNIQSATQVDAMLPISNVTVSAYDKANLLGGASPSQLYEMSVAAGLNATQAQFLGSAVFAPRGAPAGSILPVGVFCGAPLVIDFSNLSLPKDIAVGSDAQTQIQFNVTVTNNFLQTATSAATTLNGFQLQLLVVTDGILTVEGGASTWTLGGLTAEDVTRTRAGTAIQSLEVNRLRAKGSLSGGSFLDILKGIGQAVLPIVGAFNPALAGVTGIASKLLGAGAKSPHAGHGGHPSGRQAKAGYY